MRSFVARSLHLVARCTPYTVATCNERQFPSGLAYETVLLHHCNFRLLKLHQSCRQNQKSCNELQRFLQPRVSRRSRGKDQAMNNSSKPERSFAECRKIMRCEDDQTEEFTFAPALRTPRWRQSEFPWRYQKDRRWPNYERCKKAQEKN